MDITTQIYNHVKEQCAGLDAINGAYIIQLVGEFGLGLLKEAKLVETCGVVKGNRLYVLLDMPKIN